MKVLSLAVVLALMVSCASNGINETTLQTDAELLAQLQCEAKKLQEERFQLATDIRLLEDSIRTGTNEALIQIQQIKLDALIAGKEDMWLRTKAMADSVTLTLNNLHQGAYKDTADRKLLDVAMMSQFERICK